MSELSVGDVVVIKEGGWGFTDFDVGKSVKLLKKDHDSGCSVNAYVYWHVEPYDCQLETEDLGSIIHLSFGTNPLILFNVLDKPQLENGCVTPIKSDGGSSSYYDIQLPNWLVEEIYSRYEQGQGFIKTEELIEVAFKNDFDFGTTFKALVRGFGSLNGGGKAGNDVEYEMNKVGYYSNRVKERTSR